MATATEMLRRTPLHERHQAAGARLVPFAGWAMPVQYEGIRPEHEAVRTSAGLFDVSHMGQVETSGPDAERFLQHLLSNDVARLTEGGAQYSVLCRDDGGVLDDLFTYRLGERFLTVTNASNHQRDHDWLAAHSEGFDVTVTDVAGDHAMLALQGPDARAILDRHLEGEAPARMRTASAKVAGVECLVCGTGYTGEDGVELLIPPDGAGEVWDALTGDGATPVGLGARDTLRLEVCFHLYGNDLSQEHPARGGPRLVLQARYGLHRLRCASHRGAERDPRALRPDRSGHPPARGTLKTAVKVTFAPTGGTPGTRTRALTLRLRRARR